MISNTYQQLIISFHKGGKQCLVTSVYAKYSQLENLELWEDLESIQSEGISWLVRGILM